MKIEVGSSYSDQRPFSIRNPDVFLVFDIDQISDPAVIESMVDKILADNVKQVEAYRGGKTKLQGFFVGQVEF